jgi:hypothetical protein
VNVFRSQRLAERASRRRIREARRAAGLPEHVTLDACHGGLPSSMGSRILRPTDDLLRQGPGEIFARMSTRAATAQVIVDFPV